MILRIPSAYRTGIVLLHGRGGAASDILGLLDLASVKDCAAIAPEAIGNSWWPTSFLAPERQMAPYVDAGIAKVSSAVSELEKLGLDRQNIWLCGFSQGACLALETYARAGHDLAGVLAFSGGLVGLADQGEPSGDLLGYRNKSFDYSARHSGKVWLSVHEVDPHIPLRRAKDSVACFSRMGADVSFTLYPGQGHAVMREDITALGQALSG